LVIGEGSAPSLRIVVHLNGAIVSSKAFEDEFRTFDTVNIYFQLVFFGRIVEALVLSANEVESYSCDLISRVVQNLGSVSIGLLIFVFFQLEALFVSVLDVSIGIVLGALPLSWQVDLTEIEQNVQVTIWGFESLTAELLLLTVIKIIILSVLTLCLHPQCPSC